MIVLLLFPQWGLLTQCGPNKSTSHPASGTDRHLQPTAVLNEWTEYCSRGTTPGMKCKTPLLHWLSLTLLCFPGGTHIFPCCLHNYDYCFYMRRYVENKGTQMNVDYSVQGECLLLTAVRHCFLETNQSQFKICGYVNMDGKDPHISSERFFFKSFFLSE